MGERYPDGEEGCCSSAVPELLWVSTRALKTWGRIFLDPEDFAALKGLKSQVDVSGTLPPRIVKVQDLRNTLGRKIFESLF